MTRRFPISARVRPPDGYAYRYRTTLGNDTVIRFDGSGDVNGCRPIEAVPYWLGNPCCYESDGASKGAATAEPRAHALVLAKEILRSDRVSPMVLMATAERLQRLHGDITALAPAIRHVSKHSKYTRTVRDAADRLMAEVIE
jgi:hypothetical protein